jgi:hypothetical protein
MRGVALIFAALLLGCGEDDKGWSRGTGGGDGDGGEGGTPGDSEGETGAETGGDSGGDTGGPPEPVGTGYQVGDVAYDLQATDQDGQDWSLYAHLGEPVVLAVGPMDYPTMVDTLEVLAEQSPSELGFLVVVLVDRDELSIAADTDDAQRWVETYGLDTVLLDPDATHVDVWSDYLPPKTYVIDGSMNIVWIDYGGTTAEELAEGLGA